ncbi:MAG: cob(I)yrinic acid a,c-diamide adenosyltransferase [Desulfovibrionaceae bacterium]|nr:cob(I)yrinic acid a,c-diamide adenosyltransferase [Desulfovibrionaceae bacterium]
MILVYTGLGKGKTCACVGQALRALGHNLTVAFGQFIKRDSQSGEQKILKALLGDRFLASGLGFIKTGSLSSHKMSAEKLLNWAKALLPSLDMLILDELCYALHYELIEKDAVLKLIHTSPHTHFVFSGRFAPDWLLAKANLITIMHPEKHPYNQGIKASLGLDY